MNWYMILVLSCCFAGIGKLLFRWWLVQLQDLAWLALAGHVRLICTRGPGSAYQSMLTAATVGTCSIALPYVPAGSVEASVNLNNPLGYAEQVSLTAEYGSQSTNVFSLAITKPKPAGLPLLLDFRLNQLFHR